MPAYLNMIPSHAIGERMSANLAALGRPPSIRDGQDGAGSTDFGNVSHRIPASCINLKICDKDASWHSTAVADATITPLGHATILDGAKTLAMTAIDMLFDQELLTAAAAEHQAAMALVES